MDALFIIGTGRSGTHFLTRHLSGFKNIHDPQKGKENSKLLREIATAALFHAEYPQNAVDYYTNQFSQKPANHIFLDQHHSNLFFTDELQRISSATIFLCPIRPLKQIVASMLNHEGVLSWYTYLKDHSAVRPPMPNQFFGIHTMEEFHTEEFHIICAKRVLSHYEKFSKLHQSFPEIFRWINYEKMVLAPADHISEIFNPTELKLLGEFIPKESSQPSSLIKFNTTLTSAQIRDLDNIQEEADCYMSY